MFEFEFTKTKRQSQSTHIVLLYLTISSFMIYHHEKNIIANLSRARARETRTTQCHSNPLFSPQGPFHFQQSQRRLFSFTILFVFRALLCDLSSKSIMIFKLSRDITIAKLGASCVGVGRKKVCRCRMRH